MGIDVFEHLALQWIADEHLARSGDEHHHDHDWRGDDHDHDWRGDDHDWRGDDLFVRQLELERWHVRAHRR